MHILIIEDDKFFQNFYTSKLTEEGIDVDVAKDGEEGISKARTVKPNLIILDIIMPKVDGFIVLQALKSDEELKNIPVLVFSTLGQNQDIEKAKNLGAADFVNKSFFDYDKLKSKIQQLAK